MQNTETPKIYVRCPLCNLRLKFVNLKAHAEKNHPKMSEAQYESLLIEHFKRGMLKISEIAEKKKKGRMFTGTSALHKSKTKTSRIRSVVSGGGVGSGKKR